MEYGRFERRIGIDKRLRLCDRIDLLKFLG
jgi:hypothetical protein